MRIILTGGGTAGHINPALAIAKFIELKDKDSKILYIGGKGNMEEEIIKKQGIEFKGIEVSGFSRKLNLNGICKNIKTVKRAFKALKEAKKIIKDFNPDICVGTGGYVSGPILWQAYRMKVPFVIHEQNAFPGITTKILAKRAKKVMLASNAAKDRINKKSEVIVTGNPIRDGIGDLSKEEAKKKLGFDEKPVILSFGGSLGSRRINEAILDLIYLSRGEGKRKYNHIHGFGRNGLKFKENLKKRGIDEKNEKGLIIEEYIDDMDVKMAAADLVICRAGAITISELQIMGKPAILIPSPNVSENHQYYNAKELVDLNSASMIEEKDLSGEKLILEVDKILSDKNIEETYSKNIKKLAKEDCKDKIYEIIRQYSKIQK